MPSFSTENTAPTGTPVIAAHPAADRPNADLLKRQEAVVAIGRRAIALPELSVLMHDAAQLMAEMLDAEYGAVVECTGESDEITLALLTRDQPASAPQLHRLPGADAQSLAAYTLRGRQPILAADLSEEKRFQDPLLNRLRVQSALSVPLVVHGRAFGALAAFSTRPFRFAPEDVFFAETIAHLVATTIDRKRTEDLLAEERRLAGATLDTIDALVLLLDGEGRIQSINRAGRRLTGFTSDELRGRTVWSVFSAPDEAAGLKSAFGRLQQGEAALGHQSLLVTRSARKRRIAWNYGSVRDDAGRLKAVVATGIVITEPPRSDGAGNGAVAGLPLPLASGRDRRTERRKPFPYEQMLAPLLEKKLPARDTFKPVVCQDISPGGFSFVAPSPPACESFVVALGRGSSLTYVIAQVAHVTRLEQNGERVYVIGCSYMGRAEY